MDVTSGSSSTTAAAVSARAGIPGVMVDRRATSADVACRLCITLPSIRPRRHTHLAATSVPHRTRSLNAPSVIARGLHLAPAGSCDARVAAAPCTPGCTRAALYPIAAAAATRAGCERRRRADAGANHDVWWQGGHDEFSWPPSFPACRALRGEAMTRYAPPLPGSYPIRLRRRNLHMRARWV